MLISSIDDKSRFGTSRNSKSSCVVATNSMTDNREQADKKAIHTNENTDKDRRRKAAVFEVTSLAHRSKDIHIGTSGNAYHFHGDVYVSGGGIKVKHATVERSRRRENQRARRSTSISDAEREARREAHHQEWQARQERQRKENESRWQERDRKEGRKLSKEEHRSKDLEEEKEKAGRKTSRPLTSFFQPVLNGLQNVDCSASEAAGTLTDFSTVDANEEGDRVEDLGANEENCTEQESTFKQGMKVFLRLAFIDSEKIDSMFLKDVKKHIRQKGIIGRVIIEEMVERDVARLNLAEFGKLRDYSQRDAGGDVKATLFSKLKEALNKVNGRVDTKYLTKQNRQFGENHKWTEKQVEQIRKVVEEAKQQWPDSCFAKAAKILRNRFKGPRLGDISSSQVRNVYRQRVERRDVPRAPVGRPRKLSLRCIEALKAFARTAINKRYSHPVYYYMHCFNLIIQKHGEAEQFANNCENPRKYLRDFIRIEGGSRRKVTKQGGKHLSIEQRKRFTDTFMLRLAYLVKRHDLKREDVFNFDETALRYNEDDGMVIAPTGAKHVEANPSESRTCPKQCLTSIPMVSCAGDKLDPAVIFKGTSGLTRSIPGYKDGFTKWNELYGEGKLCFMQNKGKWTTNKTMKEWFTGYIIPRIREDKQRRRDAGQQVSPKYVVILDGVSTHCLTQKDGVESWITSLQREDEDLILLWLPPNTTGDLQPLDVNFNRPFKAKYRDELYKIKLLAGQKDDICVEDFVQCNGAEEDVVTGEDGTEFHLDVGGVIGDTRSQTIVTREHETAFTVKSRVIEAIISAYKSIAEDYITTTWKVSGKTVIQEFYEGKFQNYAHRWKGYDQAWEEQVQNIAQRTQDNEEKLFYKGMSGGISDIELNLQFIPTAGRKKKQVQDAQEDVDMEEGQTTEQNSVEMSEYDTDECPDEDEDSTDDDDELVEGLNELALYEETGQTSP